MKKNKIDLSDIKSNDLEDTATFTDLMPKKNKKNEVSDDIEDMINEKKRNTKDLTKEVEKAKEIIKEDIDNTKVYDIKEEKIKKVSKKKKEDKKSISFITDIGVFILIVISYFIFCLLYTSFYDNDKVLLTNIITIIVIFILYAFSILFNKKISKIICIIIFLLLIGFIALNLINSIGLI